MTSIFFKGVGKKPPTSSWKDENLLHAFWGKLELHASQNQLLGPFPQKRGVRDCVCRLSQGLCFFVGISKSPRSDLSFPFIFRIGIRVFFLSFFLFSVQRRK